MTICELSELMDAEIVIRYRTQPPLVGTERWYAMLDGAEVKDDVMLSSRFGNGHSPATALLDYIKNIRGKTLVLNAMNKEKRREYQVPTTLEVM